MGPEVTSHVNKPNLEIPPKTNLTFPSPLGPQTVWRQGLT